MTSLIIIIIPKSLYFQTILVVLTAVCCELSYRKVVCGEVSSSVKVKVGCVYLCVASKFKFL
jgi:uncharacterized membrane protein